MIHSFLFPLTRQRLSFYLILRGIAFYRNIACIVKENVQDQNSEKGIIEEDCYRTEDIYQG